MTSLVSHQRPAFASFLALASAWLFAVALVLVSFGCGSARRGEPLVGPVELASADVHAGRLVFMRQCHQCHPGGEAGLGPALNNKPLPGFLIKLQVRQGFGVMPGFGEEQISDGRLDQLVAYLKVLRSHEETKPEAPAPSIGVDPATTGVLALR